MSKSLFIGFMEKMLNFPLWIKQTIFLNLTKDLNTYLSNEFLDVEEGEIRENYNPHKVYLPKMVNGAFGASIVSVKVK